MMSKVLFRVTALLLCIAMFASPEFAYAQDLFSVRRDARQDNLAPVGIAYLLTRFEDNVDFMVERVYRPSDDFSEGLKAKRDIFMKAWVIKYAHEMAVDTVGKTLKLREYQSLDAAERAGYLKRVEKFFVDVINDRSRKMPSNTRAALKKAIREEFAAQRYKLSLPDTPDIGRKTGDASFEGSSAQIGKKSYGSSDEDLKKAASKAQAMEQAKENAKRLAITREAIKRLDQSKSENEGRITNDSKKRLSSSGIPANIAQSLDTVLGVQAMDWESRKQEMAKERSAKLTITDEPTISAIAREISDRGYVASVYTGGMTGAAEHQHNFESMASMVAKLNEQEKALGFPVRPYLPNLKERLETIFDWLTIQRILTYLTVDKGLQIDPKKDDGSWASFNTWQYRNRPDDFNSTQVIPINAAYDIGKRYSEPDIYNDIQLTRELEALAVEHGAAFAASVNDHLKVENTGISGKVRVIFVEPNKQSHTPAPKGRASADEKPRFSPSGAEAGKTSFRVPSYYPFSKAIAMGPYLILPYNKWDTKTFSVYDVRNKKCVFEDIKAFDADGNFVGVLDRDSCLTIYEVRDGRLVKCGKFKNVTSFHLTSTHLFIFCDEDMSFKKEYVYKLSGDKAEFLFSADVLHGQVRTPTHFAAQGFDLGVNVYDLKTGKPVPGLTSLGQYVRYQSHATASEFTLTNTHLAVLYSSKILKVYDLKTGNCVLSIPKAIFYKMDSDGLFVKINEVSTGDNKYAQLKAYDLHTLKEIDALSGKVDAQYLKTIILSPSRLVAVYPIEKTFVVDSGTPKKLVIHDRGSVEVIKTIENVQEYQVSWPHAAVGNNGAATLYDLSSGEVVKGLINIPYATATHGRGIMLEKPAFYTQNGLLYIVNPTTESFSNPDIYDIVTGTAIKARPVPIKTDDYQINFEFDKEAYETIITASSTKGMPLEDDSRAPATEGEKEKAASAPQKPRLSSSGEAADIGKLMSDLKEIRENTNILPEGTMLTAISLFPQDDFYYINTSKRDGERIPYAEPYPATNIPYHVQRIFNLHLMNIRISPTVVGNGITERILRSIIEDRPSVVHEFENLVDRKGLEEPVSLFVKIKGTDIVLVYNGWYNEGYPSCSFVICASNEIGKLGAIAYPPATEIPQIEINYCLKVDGSATAKASGETGSATIEGENIPTRGRRALADKKPRFSPSGIAEKFNSIPSRTYEDIVGALKPLAAAKDRPDFTAENLKPFEPPEGFKAILRVIQADKPAFAASARNFHDYGYYEPIKISEIENRASPIIDIRLLDKRTNPNAEKLLDCLTDGARGIIADRHSREPDEKIKLTIDAVKEDRQEEFFRLAGKAISALERAKANPKEVIMNTLQAPWDYLAGDADLYKDRANERLTFLVGNQESGIAWAVAILGYARMKIANGEEVNIEYLMKSYHAGWSLSNVWDKLSGTPYGQLGADQIKKDWMCLKVVIDEMGLADLLKDIVNAGTVKYEDRGSKSHIDYKETIRRLGNLPAVPQISPRESPQRKRIATPRWPEALFDANKPISPSGADWMRQAKKIEASTKALVEQGQEKFAQVAMELKKSFDDAYGVRVPVKNLQYKKRLEAAAEFFARARGIQYSSVNKPDFYDFYKVKEIFGVNDTGLIADRVRRGISNGEIIDHYGDSYGPEGNQIKYCTGRILGEMFTRERYSKDLFVRELTLFSTAYTLIESGRLEGYFASDWFNKKLLPAKRQYFKNICKALAPDFARGSADKKPRFSPSGEAAVVDTDAKAVFERACIISETCASLIKDRIVKNPIPITISAESKRFAMVSYAAAYLKTAQPSMRQSIAGLIAEIDKSISGENVPERKTAFEFAKACIELGERTVFSAADVTEKLSQFDLGIYDEKDIAAIPTKAGYKEVSGMPGVYACGDALELLNGLSRGTKAGAETILANSYASEGYALTMRPGKSEEYRNFVIASTRIDDPSDRAEIRIAVTYAAEIQRDIYTITIAQPDVSGKMIPKPIYKPADQTGPIAKYLYSTEDIQAATITALKELSGTPGWNLREGASGDRRLSTSGDTKQEAEIRILEIMYEIRKSETRIGELETARDHIVTKNASPAPLQLYKIAINEENTKLGKLKEQLADYEAKEKNEITAGTAQQIIENIKDATSSIRIALNGVMEQPVAFSGFAIIMNENLTKLSGRNTAELESTYKALKQDLRDAFKSEGGEFIEVSPKDNIADTIKLMRKKNLKVIVLDDGSLARNMDAAKIDGIAGTDYCVVSTELLKDMDIGKDEAPFINPSAMAMLGVGRLDGKPTLVGSAYEAFTGEEATDDIISKIMDAGSWIIKLPKVVRFKLKDLIERGIANKIVEAAA